MSTRIADAAPCSRCGLPADAWPQLELLDWIGGQRVREYVTTWSDHEVIEVRRCTCGQVVARKSTASADVPRVATRDR